MSLKKFFVLFSPSKSMPPTLYKTQATVNKYLIKTPELQFKKFDSEAEAMVYMTQLYQQNNNMSDLSDDSEGTPAIPSATSTTTVHHQKESPQTLSTKPLDTGSQNPQQLDALYKYKLDNLKNKQLFRGFVPSPINKSPVPSKLNLFFDGSSVFNPGPAGIGYVAKSGVNKTYFKKGWGIGFRTNNEAEYTALAWGLLDCVEKGVVEVKVMGDSQLVLKSMAGIYNLKKDKLVAIHNICRELEDFFLKVEYEKIPRNLNSEADALAGTVTQRAVKRAG